MKSLSSIFHRKTPSNSQVEDEAKNKAGTLSQQPETASYTGDQKTVTVSALQPTAPLYAPGTGPAAHGQMVQANNIGMLGGAIIGSEMGGNPVTGMIEGQVGANMVMQRIQQEQRHQYYREQALRYRAGLPADGVGPAGGLAPPPAAGFGRDRSRSRSQGREERRRKRWERRAKRRDGGGGGVSGNEDLSGSEGD